MRSAPREDAPSVFTSHSVHLRPGASGSKPSRFPTRPPPLHLPGRCFSSYPPLQPAARASSFVTKFGGRCP